MKAWAAKFNTTQRKNTIRTENLGSDLCNIKSATK